MEPRRQPGWRHYWSRVIEARRRELLVARCAQLAGGHPEQGRSAGDVERWALQWHTWDQHARGVVGSLVVVGPGQLATGDFGL
jgi:hypothetical protein